MIIRPSLLRVRTLASLQVWETATGELHSSIEVDHGQISHWVHPATYLNKMLLASKGAMQLWNIRRASLEAAMANPVCLRGRRRAGGQSSVVVGERGTRVRHEYGALLLLCELIRQRGTCKREVLVASEYSADRTAVAVPH